MYLCEVTEQWVVCDLMNNSRTVYAKSVDFGKACAADVLEWMVHRGGQGWPHAYAPDFPAGCYGVRVRVIRRLFTDLRLFLK